MSDKSILHEPLFLKGLAAIAGWAPAFAGAVVSLAFINQLSNRGRCMAVVVGFLTSVFLTPALAVLLRVSPTVLGPEASKALANGIGFLVALCSMSSLPFLIKWISGMAGNPIGMLSLLRAPLTPSSPTVTPVVKEGGEA